MCLLATASAFVTQKLSTVKSSRMQLSASLLDNSWAVAELYSGPAAKYNGELISESLKVVERVPKPAGYEYGAVSQDATPILAVSLLLIVSLGFLIPYILSIGEGALIQQREREEENRIGNNLFAIKSREAKKNKK